MTELRMFGPYRGSRLPAPLALAVACALAAGSVACGADPDVEPEAAMCDGPQALYPDMFAELAQQVGRVAQAVGKALAPPKDL